MKSDAISTHERDSIIRHLALTGKWRAVRLGATVEMARFKTKHGSQIQYSVTIGRDLLVAAKSKTVAEAVDDCNQIIHGRTPVPLAGRRAGHHNCTGTQPLVRNSQRGQVEESGLLELGE